MSKDPASRYELEPTSDENQGLLENEDVPRNEEQEEQESATQVAEAEPVEDPRFHQPTPSPFKRAALLLFLGFLFWLAFSMRKASWVGPQTPKVVHANRYSKEFKFRPAASPIVTETLKGGKVRVRGAAPTATPTLIPKPAPTPATPKIKKRKSSSKSKGKRKAKSKKNAVRPKVTS